MAKRYLSSPFFLIALICFFLPFFTVTCGGQKLTEVTGLQLVTGEAEDQISEDLQDLAGGGGGIPGLGDIPIPGPTPSVPIVPDVPGDLGEGPDLGTPMIWAIAAAAVALLGVFLSLVRGRTGGLLALILGAAGTVLLFLLTSAFKNAFFEDGPEAAQAKQIITIENKIGYWVALFGFILAAVTGLIRLMIPDRPAGAMPETGPSGFGQPPGAPPPAAPPPPESPPQ
ncbi:MAG: hypothetical protein ACRDHM_11395 [Actinomycetota bacterium]